jgi:hypothetical protein
MVLRNSVSFKIDVFIFIPNIPPFHHSTVSAESLNLNIVKYPLRSQFHSEPVNMKHSTQQAYFWRWWWITGGKECADRFEAG